MSTFVIFVIILTLGYILYYAAMITIDLTAKSKVDSATEETISADGMTEEDEFTPRNVVENAATGGFSFSDPVPSMMDDQEEIKEADEPELSVGTVEEEESTQDNSETRDENDDVEGQVEEPEPSEPSAPDEPESDSTSDEQPPSGEGREESIVDDDHITVMEDVDDEPVKKDDDEPFDEDKAFDKTLYTPRYGVKEIVVPAVSEQVASQAEETNAALEPITTKNVVMGVETFLEALRQGEANKMGLELRDEVQKY